MERNITLALVLAILGIAGGFLAYRFIFNEDYAYKTVIASVPVYSKIPFGDLRLWQKTAVFKTDNKAAITCNFEISALSKADVSGYRVDVKNCEKSVYIKENSAYICGNTDEEILSACHVFSCLLANVTCPENFPQIKNLIPHENELNIVWDMDLTSGGARAYSEILAAYGFIQAEAVDKNGDRKFSDYEKMTNTLFIYPYLKNGTECIQQKFMNFVQNITGNIAVQCDSIGSGVFLQYSNESRIEINGNRVYILGNEETVPKAAIIVRDILSPDWIRSLYGM